MKIELSDLSGLPEGLKAVVETEGDKATLDLSKVMPVEDLTGLKNTVVNLRSQVDEWKKLGDMPDAVSKRLADLEDKAAKGGKGSEEAQAKIDAIKQEYEGKLTGANDRIAKMMTANAASSLKAELAKAGFIPEAIDDIAATALGRIQFNDDGTPKVLTADGKPMIGNGADHGATLTDLAKELAHSKPYAVRDEGKGGGGKPPQSGGKPSEKTVTRTQWNEMSHSDRAAHSKDGGKVVDA